MCCVIANALLNDIWNVILYTFLMLVFRHRSSSVLWRLLSSFTKACDWDGISFCYPAGSLTTLKKPLQPINAMTIHLEYVILDLCWVIAGDTYQDHASQEKVVGIHFCILKTFSILA